ncbi:NHLP bacteriocin export ABC transporter permease/ATPase subunit [Streptomyces armeniacus]|uniref:NHLP bacteriocin export ABC transporter permease/ATPase subunit n=1 Tax=Streptomyces armeniacus TaxID=83291 RepID=A0A345XPI9_9ACTN|nr:NHLP bacteriocin export ABC transporter permease/ATPase subunit [Streptomyces armeniacus]AXK33555.1 NHLP bacteriocin export ABC transporter permease/ATPase subunit [Streptomyces armeniacus]
MADGTDPVAAVLGCLGEAVAPDGPGGLDLAGPQVLWLVTSGALDLFAVDQQADGPWQFLGRATAGTLLLGPVDGTRHTLTARPAESCALRRIPLQGLHQREEPGDGNPGRTEEAFALGIGRGLGVLFETPLGDRAADEDPGVLWMDVPPGSVRQGPGALLVDGEMWRALVAQQFRLLSAVDRWIEEAERAHQERTAAGIRAGESVRVQADQTLLASIGTDYGRGPREHGDDATYAVCRLVAEAAGATLPARSAIPPGGERVDPVERIAAAARLRTRAVRLTGSWWRTNCGPLAGHRAASSAPVALLWRRGGYVAVNAAGRRVRVRAETAAQYAPRAVMFYRPLPDRPLTPLRLLAFSLRGSRGDLRTLLLAGLVTVALGALVPVATGQVLGEYVPAARDDLIVLFAVAVIAAAVVGAAFGLLQNLTLLRLEGRMEATLQPAVWDRLLRLPTRFFAGRSTGELASAAMGVTAMRRLLAGVGPVVLQSGTMGAVNLLLLLLHSVPLALGALGVLAVVAGLFALLGLRELHWQRQLVALTNKLNNQAYQTLRGLPKLRVAGAESFAYAAWAREFARSRELERRAGRIRNATTVLNAVYLPLSSLLLFMLLAGPARDTLSPAAFLTFSTALTMLLTSATQLTGALISATAAIPLFEQIRPVLREAPEVAEDNVQPGPLTGALQARGLSFRYTEYGPLVLDGIDLSVRPGEFVAVVGPSGCGKSTLLRLLIGFETPLRGDVLYDGQDLAALDQAAVRRRCGVVLQHARPLTGSVLECVRGAEDFSEEEVWQALEWAGLAEDVQRMPMGLHTVVSGGDTISGGQRQRLLIAQALVRRPRILFLDEATSALDNTAQRRIIESTRALDATRIVIAHRLSTVMDADRLIVLDAGRIVQQGPPAALLGDPGGPLQELVRRQLE